MSVRPVVSIVIPAFNRSEVIRRSLDSVMRQTYTDWECIVVDDGSTDETISIVDEYIGKDNRFSCVANSRKKGAQGARNEGIVHARGEWILLFDSDDSMHHDYLEKVAPLLTNDNNIVACYGRMVEENSGKEIETLDNIKEGRVLKELLRGDCYYTYNAFVVRKKCLEEIGLLDEVCPSHQELETHLRLSRLCHYRVVHEVLWDYYVGRGDSISVDKRRHIEGLLYIREKHWLAYRIMAYRRFLNGMRFMWELSEGVPEKESAYKWKIIRLAPELPLLLFKRKVKKLWRS